MNELKEYEPFEEEPGSEPWADYCWRETIEAIDRDIEWQKRELKRIGGNIDEYEYRKM